MSQQWNLTIAPLLKAHNTHYIPTCKRDYPPEAPDDITLISSGAFLLAASVGGIVVLRLAGYLRR
jgi:hypothetical protein